MKPSRSVVTLGIVMDPLSAINIKKDSTFAMMLAAQKRGWQLYFMQQGDLYADNGVAYAQMTPIQLQADQTAWYVLGTPVRRTLHSLSAVLMRKDPPFNMEYIYSTYLLELAQRAGALIVNRPESVRAANEKLFTAWFPEWTPATRLTCDMALIREFLDEQQHIVVKPLDGMGGSMIFQLKHDDPNRNVILETMTDYGRRTVMAQQFLPEFKQGDKRILLIDGEAFPYGLSRIPAQGESRGNLAAGAKGVGTDLTEREQAICKAIGPVLREMGLLFVGLDVIGDYVTEINVTSPTGIRELDSFYQADIASLLLDAIEKRLV